MINQLKVLAIVPARGGSKGIPRKNIIDIQGQPLIYYTLNEAKQSQYIDGIFISTEDIEIAECVEHLGFPILKMRPNELAQDTSKTIDVMIDVKNYYGAQAFDIIVLLQPTQPLRKAKHIDEAIELFIENGCQSLVSVCEVEEHPLLMRTIDAQHQLKPILQQQSTVRRQDFQKTYIVNGAIYINLYDEFTPETSLNDNVIPYIMDRKYHLDIDTYKDLTKLREILKGRVE